MEVIHTVPVNLVSPGNEPVLHAMQHDGVRQITAQLYAGATVWEVPNGVTAGIGYTLPNRLSGYYESLSDGTAACTVNGNTVTAVLAPILTSVAGETKASIIFAKNGVQLSTVPFRIRVAARPGQVDNGVQPDTASPFVGKLYYGGDKGIAIPLGLGAGVRVAQQADGSFILTVEGGGSGGGISQEMDPTVPAWAKQTNKPSYTAEEVGAEPAGAISATMTGHNTERYSHNDIRIQLQELSDRVSFVLNSTDEELDQLVEIVAYIKSNKTLIDAVTTSKVSVADIVDNLVTNVSNKPLSAAMGASLAGEIDSLRSAMPKRVGQLQNDKGYLTEHQDISHLLPKAALDIKICDDNLLHLVIDGQPVGDGVRMLGAEFVGAHYEVDENGNPVLDENGDPVVSFYERFAIDYLDALASYE